MAGATRSIYLEMYIFLGDTQKTHDFLSLLKKKATEGVEVVLIVDAIGSLGLKAEAVKELKAAGVEIIFFSHWLKRTHRKILIIDQATAFLGGVNIEEKTRYWRDLQVSLKGWIVKPILKSFAYTYKMSGGHNVHILIYNSQSFTKRLKSWLVDNWSNTQHSYYLNVYYKQKILEAKESIVIVTPYLLPPSWLLALLDGAVRRGVRVEFIMSQKTDIKILDHINYLNTCRLSEIGVKFYFMTGMNHAKLMLVDDEEGIVGSPNIDILSFGPNGEIGVFSRQKDLVRDLKHIVDTWRRQAVEFKGDPLKVTFWDRCLINIFKFVYPIF
jgi:cardiolipin synthase